ncbi:hypothetical protein HZS_2455 [Henneguya salminicola]|nr:hypothetical protein HZS_2455 [Henneguya salminicola]
MFSLDIMIFGALLAIYINHSINSNVHYFTLKMYVDVEVEENDTLIFSLDSILKENPENYKNFLELSYFDRENKYFSVQSFKNGDVFTNYEKMNISINVFNSSTIIIDNINISLNNTLVSLIREKIGVKQKQKIILFRIKGYLISFINSL